MRVVIIGNSGSGKTTMARRLSAERGLALLSMDALAFSEGATRRPPAESVEMLERFMAEHEAWVIEGCYAYLAEAAVARCTELRFLNPGVEACVANCRRREWEPDKFDSREAQDAMLERLIDWVRQYEVREDEYGVRRHRAVFEEFDGVKREYVASDLTLA